MRFSDILARIVAAESKYLEYLDKEMTIMGILSTFCAAVLALVLDRICGADPAKDSVFLRLWLEDRTFVLLGVVFTGIAGALFYKQRSALAWFYGQISLSLECPAINETSTEDWYRDADSWATWIPYQSAFTALMLAALFFFCALLSAAQGPRLAAPFVYAVAAVLAIAQSVRMSIYYKYKYEDDPIGEVFPALRKRGSGAPKLRRSKKSAGGDRS